jgi:hypothetical protein
MTYALILGAVIGSFLTAAGYERLVRGLRLELNTARANEQLLLTRLASRTPAEFHAVVRQDGLDIQNQAPPIDNRRHLYDQTGLVHLAIEDE